MYPRFLTPRLLEALQDTPVVFLAGARQVGKSTLVRSLGYGRYLTLDDPLVLASAQHDPLAFLQAQEGPLVLDEVQRAPGLLRAIKLLVDQDRRPGRFLLTGSANVLVLPQASGELVGRMEVLTLWPLSQGELEGKEEKFLDLLFSPRFPSAGRLEAVSLEERVFRGGFPEAVTRKGRRRQAWFEAYLKALLERDLRDLSRIHRLLEVPKVLGLLALRLGSPMNQSEVARGAGLPLSTLRDYLALLEALFLVVRVPAWTPGGEGRLVKAPKLYFVDSGLAASLLRYGGLALDQASSFGPLLENFVVLEILKGLGWSQVAPNLYHFRTHTGQEVDLVLEWEGRVVGLEVKASRTLGLRDFSGLKALRSLAKDRFLRGVVLYGGEEILAVERDLLAVPIQALWRLTP
ncbi:ATP-binding protein [Thermus scotoductus]|uniref:ATP-binding protein n=1 Tax=Thermus scotoductus TaxID=37636 RepID=UPI00242F3924|nr:ATP-binding protein [Thermus scotoductus]